MISIVTLTFNNPDELKKTLESLPKEDFIESVVINGGDSEATLEYLKSFPGKAINEKDSGIADAFNKGIKNSSGDSVMFLNSGDILIDPSYLNDAVKILEDSPEIYFIHSNMLYKDLTGADLFMKPTFSNPGRGMPYLHPTMIVRKNIFEKIGLFNLDYKIAMDFDLIVRMEKEGFKGYYRNKGPVVIMDGKGKSAVKEGEAIKECFRSLKENKILTTKNLSGLSIRVILFFIRKIFLIGGSSILKLLKERKYSKN